MLSISWNTGESKCNGDGKISVTEERFDGQDDCDYHDDEPYLQFRIANSNMLDFRSVGEIAKYERLRL